MFISFPNSRQGHQIDNSLQDALQERIYFNPASYLLPFVVLNKYAPGRARYEVLFLERDASGTLIRQGFFLEILQRYEFPAAS